MLGWEIRQRVLQDETLFRVFIPLKVNLALRENREVFFLKKQKENNLVWRKLFCTFANRKKIAANAYELDIQHLQAAVFVVCRLFSEFSPEKFAVFVFFNYLCKTLWLLPACILWT